MAQILSQKNAVSVARGRNVLMMNSPAAECGRTAMERVERIRAEAADCLYLEFHDIFAPRPGLIHPQEHYVREALEWGRDKDPRDTIYVCQAGISRSSAMAYVLNAARVGPWEAIKELDPDTHYPNSLIVSLGADLIGRGDYGWRLNEAVWGSERYPEFSSKTTTARLIVAVYREYIADVESRLQNEVPLEFIEHKGCGGN